MADVQRPTVLTVLAVLAIIGGVFGVLGAFGWIALVGVAFAAGQIGTGISLIIMLVLSVITTVLALIAGINTLGNKPGCLDWMKKYAMASIGANVIIFILNIIVYGTVGVVGLIVGCAIGGAILYFLMKNEDVIAYGNSLQ